MQDQPTRSRVLAGFSSCLGCRGHSRHRLVIHLLSCWCQPPDKLVLLTPQPWHSTHITKLDLIGAEVSLLWGWPVVIGEVMEQPFPPAALAASKGIRYLVQMLSVSQWVYEVVYIVEPLVEHQEPECSNTSSNQRTNPNLPAR